MHIDPMDIFFNTKEKHTSKLWDYTVPYSYWSYIRVARILDSDLACSYTLKGRIDNKPWLLGQYWEN